MKKEKVENWKRENSLIWKRKTERESNFEAREKEKTVLLLHNLKILQLFWSSVGVLWALSHVLLRRSFTIWVQGITGV